MASVAAKKVPYTVEIWDGQRLVEIIAATTELAVAYAALEAALRLRPGQQVVIRQGDTVIRQAQVDREHGVRR